MEGNISLGDFIEQVKTELIEAHQKSTSRFLVLQEVEREDLFELGIEGEVKGKLIVVEGQAKASATQVHKAKLKFVPKSKDGILYFTDFDATKPGESTEQFDGQVVGQISKSSSSDEWVFKPVHSLDAEIFELDRPISVRFINIPANESGKQR